MKGEGGGGASRTGVLAAHRKSAQSTSSQGRAGATEADLALETSVGLAARHHVGAHRIERPVLLAQLVAEVTDVA